MPELQPIDLPAAAEALARALETMAFVSLLPVDGPPAPPAEAMRVGIEFEAGGRRGRVVLLASRQLGAAIAANVLGPDATADEAEAHAADALTEAMNVTCGLLLSGPGVGPVRMGIPTVEPCGEESARALAADGQGAAFDADGLACVLWVEDE